MTAARTTQVSLADTPYYYGNARCVRRAFLCGINPLTGENWDSDFSSIHEACTRSPKPTRLQVVRYWAMGAEFRPDSTASNGYRARHRR